MRPTEIFHRLNGVQVNVVCNEYVYSFPPEAGSVISIKYDGYDGNGKLHLNHLYPVYLRVRLDADWEKLKEQYNKTL